jgi:ferredoxin-NADP reductase
MSLEMLKAELQGLENPICYICGMSPFVDAVSNGLLELGIPAEDIKTERFG